MCFFLAHIIHYSILCTCITFCLLFLLLHIIIVVVVVVLESKTEESFNKRHVYSILNKRNQHTLPYPCSAYFISFFCIAIHVSLFLPYLQTIHLNVRLSLRNRQKKPKHLRSCSWIFYLYLIICFRSKMSTGKDIDEERRLLFERLNVLNQSELHAFDLQLTLLRTAFESYKRETVFKPCPSFLVGLTDDELVWILHTLLICVLSLFFSLFSTMSFVYHLLPHLLPCSISSVIYKFSYSIGC